MSRLTNYQEYDFWKSLVDGETTVKKLSKALKKKNIGFKPLPGFIMEIDNTEYYRLQQHIDCDEVYPGIIIGNGSTAKQKRYLSEIGITHVLNAAEGNFSGYVNTNSEFYSDTNIKYLGFRLYDSPIVDISKYFYPAANFIEDALSTTSGKVYVHCVMGVSRSATLVIAYLMIKRHMLAEEAIRLLRESRAIHPNHGFLEQLATLDNQLRRNRL
ncbi:hypothetical protein PV326_002863 [Microctonus aethiopoides]|nr:hypothetical protein PV326_002863 [Microctonus aethiopoides]